MSKITPVRQLVLLPEEARGEFDYIAKKFERSGDWSLANEENWIYGKNEFVKR